MCERFGGYGIDGKDRPEHVTRHSLYSISLPPAEPLAVCLQFFKRQFVKALAIAVRLLIVQARLYHGDETAAEDITAMPSSVYK